MKKSLLLLFFIFLSMIASAQSPFKGFFKPLPKDLFKNNAYNSTYFKGVTDSLKTGIWIFRFDATITAIQLKYNKELKTWVSSPLNSAGPGIGYKHYISVDGKPYNDFGINALALLGYNWSKIDEAAISIVGTVNFLNNINIGGGYDFTNHAPVIVLGATISF